MARQHIDRALVRWHRDGGRHRSAGGGAGARAGRDADPAERERRRRAPCWTATASPRPAAAARATMRGRVDREELSEALALRDALLPRCPYPVLLFDGVAAAWCGANARRRARLLPRLAAAGTTPSRRRWPRRSATPSPAGRPRPAEVTVYEPERRRYHAHVRGYATRDGHAAARWCWRRRAPRPTSATPAACSRPASRTSCERRWRGCWRWWTRSSLPLGRGRARATMLDGMRDEIDGMRRLIEEMVLLVRLESGEQAGRGESADVTDAVAGCVSATTERAERARVTLSGEAHARAGRRDRAAAAGCRARQPGRATPSAMPGDGRRRAGAAPGPGRRGRARGRPTTAPGIAARAPAPRVRAVLPRRGVAQRAGHRAGPGDRQAHRRGARRHAPRSRARSARGTTVRVILADAGGPAGSASRSASVLSTGSNR